jgi:hypothetical protein
MTIRRRQHIIIEEKKQRQTIPAEIWLHKIRIEMG